MKTNRFLVKINRISGWLMLIIIVIYMISGYALTKHIKDFEPYLMSRELASYLHTTLDIYMMPVFLAHVLINAKFTLKRWGFRSDKVVNAALLLVGIASYILVLMVR